MKASVLSELRSAQACVGVITPKANESAWVIAELGARLGLGKHFAPVLHPQASFGLLPAPFKGHFSTLAGTKGQMLNLIDQISEETGCPRRRSVRINEAAETLVERTSRLAPLPHASSGPAPAKGMPSPMKVAGIVRNFHTYLNLTVPEHVRGLLALGEHQAVLALVLLEQEKLVREQVRGTTPRTYSRDYSRDYMDRLCHLVVDLVAENPRDSEEVLVTFALTLFDRLIQRGDVYMPEFGEQITLLSSEIDEVYGKACLPLLDRILPRYPNVKSPLVEVWRKYATVADLLKGDGKSGAKA